MSDKQVEPELVHLVMDNYATHRAPSTEPAKRAIWRTGAA